MGGNGPNGILGWFPKLGSQPGCLAEQCNEMIGDVGFANPFSSVFKQVRSRVCPFCGLGAGADLWVGRLSRLGSPLLGTAGWGSKNFHAICSLERAGTKDALPLQAGLPVHQPSLVPSRLAHTVKG
jgi:hypothetical protein